MPPSTSYLLCIPFRRSPPVSLSEPIKKYISSKYDQHPEQFEKDLEAIDQMRTAAIHATDPHVSGIKKLQAYAAQLVWISGKFPIDIGVEFPWYPAIGYNTQRPDSQNNIRFELANVLFNLASMYSQLAMSNTTTPDALKQSYNYFSLAAGVLSHLKTIVLPELRSTPPEDMDHMTLECLEQLLLAQAQECFWSKAVKDNLKDATVAKLAARVSDLYADAMEYGTKSDSISSEWIHHMTAKHHHFAGAAQFRAAMDCLDKRHHGEEVARLQDSMKCVNEALREQRYINSSVLSGINALRSRVQEDLKRAEKDNDMIYLQPVPPKTELRSLERVNMVSPKIPLEVSSGITMLGDNSELGRPLFTKLVPYAVHVAANNYEQRKTNLVNSTIVESLEALTAAMHGFLASLNLPGCLQAVEKPLGLPSSVVSHAEEIRQQDGLARLTTSLAETEKVKATDTAMYREGVEFLQAEAAEDDAARRKYGTERWTRQRSEDAVPKLWTQLKEIEGYLQHANNGDDQILKKFHENERLIRLLAGRNHDLEHYVPNSRQSDLSPPLRLAANKLRGLLNTEEKLREKRKRHVDMVRVKMKGDDINADLLHEAARLENAAPLQKLEPSQFDALFDTRLQAYKPDQAWVSDSEAEQASLCTAIRSAHASFLSARHGDETTRAREAALQDLERAFGKYKELVSNLEAGRSFYNDLLRVVKAFRDECCEWARRRREDVVAWEEDARTGLGAATGRGDELRRARERERERMVAAAAAAAAATSQRHGEMGVGAGNTGRTFAVPGDGRSGTISPSPPPLPHHPHSGQHHHHHRDSPTPLPSGAPIPSPEPTASVAAGNVPLAVPLPTRPKQGAAPSFAGGGPGAGPGASGVWSPAMGIRFGGGATPGGGAGGAGVEGGKKTTAGGGSGGGWDPSKPMRFG